MHTPHSTHPPRSAPSHKLQKPSKESRVFQSLDTICSFLLKGKGKVCLLKGKVKVKMGHGKCPPPKYASGVMSLVNDQIINSGGGRNACLHTTSMINKNYQR